MSRVGFQYNLDQFRFRSAWNNAHDPAEQETYFEILAKRSDMSYDLDPVEDAVQRIAPFVCCPGTVCCDSSQRGTPHFGNCGKTQ